MEFLYERSAEITLALACLLQIDLNAIIDIGIVGLVPVRALKLSNVECGLYFDG